MPETYPETVSGLTMVKLAGLQMRNGHTRFTDVVHLEQLSQPYGGWSVSLCGRRFAPGSYYFVYPRQLEPPTRLLGGRVWRPCRQCYAIAQSLDKCVCPSGHQLDGAPCDPYVEED
jgi:hypothetical protein